MPLINDLRAAIRSDHYADEQQLLQLLTRKQPLSEEQRSNSEQSAIRMIERIRQAGESGLMEQFLGEYGLSTHEGLCLMTLAEALLRVPDQQTVSALIEDKIGGGIWSEHLGQSESALVNFSTRALLLTKSVLKPAKPDDLSSGIHSAVKRLGEPVIRRAVRQAMIELGKQFVLGETVDEALARGMKLHREGYRYSYDMLGEAALTADDAQGYLQAYTEAIEKLASVSLADECRDNPGISVKLSALHPRYEYMNRERVMRELVPRVASLASLAAEANMGFNIDAEEANRLDISLDIIEAVLSNKALAGWEGFGVVVQAYGRRCSAVLDWLYALAEKLDRKIMVRLVKGAYWDSEIKDAQVLGAPDFPVFTHKSATDVSYLCCARQILAMNDRIYSQFATHNAHTVAAILELANDFGLHATGYEFQRLHGMGEALHDVVRQQHLTQCRIYAPVGSHRQLLAYLVRRLLENGANSSFVNQLSDPDIPAASIAQDPFTILEKYWSARQSSPVVTPALLYGEERPNSIGFDVNNITDMALVVEARNKFTTTQWSASSLVAGMDDKGAHDDDRRVAIVNPSDNTDIVGHVLYANADTIEAALQAARPWSDATGSDRHKVLLQASIDLESAYGELFALLSREAGKTTLDAIAELREAVDFMRYYGLQASTQDTRPRGVYACISPWNFPLAIFLGQVSAALAAGNAVVCKPAESTAIVAWRAVQILHAAGVPREALQLLPGLGADVGRAITTDRRVQGVCFTGSTAVARQINTSMAEKLMPDAPLIAETGGLNAMIIDSTALPEQAIKDVVASAFQSAGQRCSALRILCLQEDIADEFSKMLFGAMDELHVGPVWQLQSDVGPIISRTAQDRILAYIDDAAQQGRVVKQTQLRRSRVEQGTFVAPTVIRINSLSDVTEEIFGPVLHILEFSSGDIDALVAQINASGYGLTFGLHTRIESRVEHIVSTVKAGNLYVNRNQIGAVVGSQPFGGEGLSGTGPKAGGPHYLQRFTRAGKRSGQARHSLADNATMASTDVVQQAINQLPFNDSALSETRLPGPTGEANILRAYPRGRVLCLGPTRQRAYQQAAQVKKTGCPVLIVTPIDGAEQNANNDVCIQNANNDECIEGQLAPEALEHLSNVAAVIVEGSDAELMAYRKALAKRPGPILPLVCALEDIDVCCVHERHTCIDTTAAGGNATLLASY